MVILAGVLIVTVACVIFCVPFIPGTIPPPIAQPDSHFAFHYYGSIGYRLFGTGVTYWNGGFYWGPPPASLLCMIVRITAVSEFGSISLAISGKSNSDIPFPSFLAKRFLHTVHELPFCSRLLNGHIRLNFSAIAIVEFSIEAPKMTDEAVLMEVFGR
ncbi:MAG: hypothetical protein KIS30_03490 [Thermoplasmata archaeon]|nr:hypothetical protein [Candidatus Sysuiplasma acidicola]MBX8645807.1 hypothetical protein [Candidatus Sysuiplasma acidicola]